MKEEPNRPAGPAPGPATGVTSVFRRLFPQRADNASSCENRLAPWFFALVVLLKVGIGLDAIFNGSAMARLGDGIPMSTFTPAGTQSVISLFALWGASHLMICLVCLLVLARYRTLIPLMFALLLLEHLARRLVLHFLPIAAAGQGGENAGISPVPYGFLALIIIGLVLSLWSRDNPRGQASPGSGAI
jgi:hypothetical protein